VEKKLYNIYMRPVNPYIVGNPIKDQASFFGRQDIFREVLQILRQRESNAIVLYGQRRIGKTSVLLQLEKQLAHDGEFTPVYFDLQDKAAKSLPEVLYELSQHISKVTGQAAAKSSDFNPTSDYFRSVFLPEVAQKVATGGLILLFDEFDVLDSPMQTQASEAFFPYLRAWMADVQKVKFVFVIGRRPEDLSVRTMSTFKGIQSTRVSFLSRKDAEDVVLQSEKDHSLKWDKGGVQRVLDLTHGHPYFTQLLCSVVWENAHEAGLQDTPVISAGEVDAAVMQALKFGANAFNWLWDGLPPAERVVVAAMAEVPDEIIKQDKLIETLNQSGVRLVARELEVAPETLIDWEVLIEESKGIYRFAVPLLRRWVLANRPLRRVKEELDRLNPLADTLFQGGQGFYNNNNPDMAEQQLRQALNINPNHLKARLLLGQVLLEKGNLTESVDMFDAAYQYDERAARALLIKSLLALAETQEENLQLTTYERILKIQSEQPLANEKVRAIWVKRGEALQAQENFEEALKAFEQIEDTERIAKVRSLMHDKKLALDMQRADVYEKSRQWKSALDILVQLTSEYPESETLQARVETARLRWYTESLEGLKIADEEENWDRVRELCEALEKEFPDEAEIKAYADRARTQIGVTQKYHEALGALQNGQNEQARQILSGVLVENPRHLKAAQKLIESTYGKVKILAPVPAAVQVIAMISTVLWTISILFASSGVLADLVVERVMKKDPPPYHLHPETFIIIGLILIPLVGVLLSFYANHVMDSVYQVERGRPSYAKAFSTHAILGMGLFYVDPESRRKWLYPFTALLVSSLVLSIIFYEVTKAMTIGNFEIQRMWEGSVADILEVMVWPVLGLYAYSFVDVIITCYRRRKNYRGPREVPTQLNLAGASSVSQKRAIAQMTSSEVIPESAETTGSFWGRWLRWLKSLTIVQFWALLTLVILAIGVVDVVLSALPAQSLWSMVFGLLVILLVIWLIATIILALMAVVKLTDWFAAKFGRLDAKSPDQSLDPTENHLK
jgi:tetratricopeptide (TPR) repeat protein